MGKPLVNAPRHVELTSPPLQADLWLEHCEAHPGIGLGGLPGSDSGMRLLVGNEEWSQEK